MLTVEVNVSSTEYPVWREYELVDQINARPYGRFLVRPLNSKETTEVHEQQIRKLVWKNPLV